MHTVCVFEFGSTPQPRCLSQSLDFILQHESELIPVEVKAGEDRSAPSFKKYVKERCPAHAIRFSKRGYRTDGLITNIPLYLADRTKELL